MFGYGLLTGVLVTIILIGVLRYLLNRNRAYFPPVRTTAERLDKTKSEMRTAVKKGKAKRKSKTAIEISREATARLATRRKARNEQKD